MNWRVVIHIQVSKFHILKCILHEVNMKHCFSISLYYTTFLESVEFLHFAKCLNNLNMHFGNVVEKEKLISFTGYYDKGEIYLDWVSDIENCYFIIESSINNFSWKEICKVSNMVGLPGIKHFSCIDNEPSHRGSYYRIRIDIDGKNAEYSDSIYILTSIKLFEITELIPNPANLDFTFVYKGYPDSLIVSLYNTNGQLIKKESYCGLEEKSYCKFSMDSLKQGTYFAKFLQNKNQVTHVIHFTDNIKSN